MTGEVIAGFQKEIFFGVLAGIIACILFLFLHQFTIVDIWFSSPFMLIISALVGFGLTKAYFALFETYRFITWFGFITYFVLSLGFISLLSMIIFTPAISSEDLLSTNAGPPNSLIFKGLPLIIGWFLISTLILVYSVTRSFQQYLFVVAATFLLFLTLGLNFALLGFVDVAPRHQFLVQKFFALNAFLGYTFLFAFDLLERFVK